jgi:hypothetical protein
MNEEDDLSIDRIVPAPHVGLAGSSLTKELLMKNFLIAAAFIGAFFLTSPNVFAQADSRDNLLREIGAKRAELAVLEKKFLSPSEDDRAAYAEFLKLPDTGLIRLLPRETYDQFPDKPPKLTIRGGGAYYSFVRLTHEYGYGSDLELSSGHLSVGFAGADYGLMTIIGDIPLEELSSEHPAAAFLTSYKPATEESRAREERHSFAAKGKIIDGATYQERLPVQLNTTYLLRSINYDDSDVFVAFRVVRKDTDGSVIIAWKLLGKYPKPKLTRNLAANQ